MQAQAPVGISQQPCHLLALHSTHGTQARDPVSPKSMHHAKPCKILHPATVAKNAVQPNATVDYYLATSAAVMCNRAASCDSVCRLRHLLAFHSNHATCWHYTAPTVPRPEILSAPKACIMQNRVKSCILQLLLRMQCSQMQLLTTT